MKQWIHLGSQQRLLEYSGELDQIEFCLHPSTENGGSPPTQQASVVEVEPGIYSVLIGHRSYEAKIVRSGDGWAVDVDGRRIHLQCIDPRETLRAGVAGGARGPQRLATPMPGRVIRVLVQEGDMVEAGQGLVVVEAMKMQNEVKAPRAGRIVSLPARAGTTVAAGEALAVLE